MKIFTSKTLKQLLLVLKIKNVGAQTWCKLPRQVSVFQSDMETIYSRNKVTFTILIVVYLF